MFEKQGDDLEKYSSMNNAVLTGLEIKPWLKIIAANAKAANANSASNPGQLDSNSGEGSLKSSDDV